VAATTLHMTPAPASNGEPDTKATKASRASPLSFAAACTICTLTGRDRGDYARWQTPVTGNIAINSAWPSRHADQDPSPDAPCPAEPLQDLLRTSCWGLLSRLLANWSTSNPLPCRSPCFSFCRTRHAVHRDAGRQPQIYGEIAGQASATLLQLLN
jgi:hypothetical protein